jgi:elongator complex protein 3
MLNLPGSTPAQDLKMFDILFSNSNFQPDLLKIYPCSVLRTAPLYKSWQKGLYKPYSDKVLWNLLLKIKRKIPYYVRIQRLIRDIPAQDIVAGSKISNLRQLLSESPQKKCRCIRCREIRGQYNSKTKLKLFREDYKASKGKEIFLSYEDAKRKNIYALLRLRISSGLSNLAVLTNAAIIRELHTYGSLVPLQQISKNKAQHIGLGKKLLSEASIIVKKEYPNCCKIAVISGVGVRDYYRKLGYRLQDDYMVKEI